MRLGFAAPIATLTFIITLGLSLWALYRDPRIINRFILHPYSVIRNNRWHTLITSGLIHADMAHLVFNMFTFYFFVFGLEQTVGSIYFIIIYFGSMIVAFAFVTPQKLDQVKYYIERTSSTEIYALEITKNLPSVKFIHNIRDPRDNYASIKSRWNKKLKNLTDSDSIEALRQTCIMRGRLGIDMGILNEKIIGSDNYFFTKYDEMVKNPNKELEKISKFLDIDKSKFNMKPTFCGLDWPGNNMNNKKFSKISSSQSGSWKERIDDEEAALMEFHFKDVFEKFNFKFSFSAEEQLDAAREHYKWLNHFSKFKADFSLAAKAKW